MICPAAICPAANRLASIRRAVLDRTAGATVPAWSVIAICLARPRAIESKRSFHGNDLYSCFYSSTSQSLAPAGIVSGRDHDRCFGRIVVALFGGALCPATA